VLDQETLDRPRRRAPRADLAQTRAAKSLLLPVVRQLPNWQLQVASLRAVVNRAALRGQSDLSNIANIERLDGLVAAARSDLELKLSEHPELCSNGRVLDVRRALDQLAITISRARFLASERSLSDAANQPK
jgi:hypothetical protein